jgi:hypothetical protein
MAAKPPNKWAVTILTKINIFSLLFWLEKLKDDSQRRIVCSRLGGESLGLKQTGISALPLRNYTVVSLKRLHSCSLNHDRTSCKVKN